MNISSLEDLYVSELKDLYSAEKQLVKALPKMAKAATSKDLKQGFEKHLKQTRGHVDRLEKVFAELDASPRGKKCKGIEALIQEGQDVINAGDDPDALDAGLIAAAQKVEHYEIAAYGCVRTYAALLGNEKAARLLQQTLDEEAATDRKLTALAEDINVEADDAEENGRRDKRRPKTVRDKILDAVGMG